MALLPDRGVVAVAGDDRVSFLQGLVSNDVAEAAPGRAVWAALLTPQGKWLADFLILSDGARLLLDCERAQAPMLVQRLTRYRLRARASCTTSPARCTCMSPGTARPTCRRTWWRHPTRGCRRPAGASSPTACCRPTADAADWDAHRIALGLPDGSRDLEAEKTVLLEAGFDELHGVSWTKGCYIGQELTARTKYRGLVKRRLVPVAIEGAAPAPGTPILRDGAEAGVLRSVAGGMGLALLRLDALGGPLACGAARLHPRPPSWFAQVS